MQVKPGDNIQVSYDASLARFSETLKGVTQPGSVMVTDYVIPNNGPTAPLQGLTPIRGGVNVTFGGGASEYANGPAVSNVTISHANARLGEPATALQISEWRSENMGFGWSPLHNCAVNTAAETVTCSTSTVGDALGGDGLFSLGNTPTVGGGGGSGGRSSQELY